jgi:hypothetical protein
MPRAKHPMVLVGKEDALDTDAFQKMMKEIAQTQCDELGVVLTVQLSQLRDEPGKIKAAIFNVHGSMAGAKKLAKHIKAIDVLYTKTYPAGTVLPATFQERASGPLI